MQGRAQVSVLYTTKNALSVIYATELTKGAYGLFLLFRKPIGVPFASCRAGMGLATVLAVPPGSQGLVLILFLCLGEIKPAGSGSFPKSADDEDALVHGTFSSKLGLFYEKFSNRNLNCKTEFSDFNQE